MILTRSIGGAGLILAAAVWAIFRVAPAPVPELPAYVEAIGNWRDNQYATTYAHLRENLVWQWTFEFSASSGLSIYLLQWLLVTLCVISILAFLYRGSAPPEYRGAAIRLALLSPIVALLFGFFGSYDTVTALLAMGLLISWMQQRAWLVGIVSLLLGLQHVGQALPMILALGLTWTALNEDSTSRQTLRVLAVGLGSAVLGKAVGLAILFFASSSTAGNRVPDGELFAPLRDAWVTSLNFLPAVIYSFLAGSWIIAAYVFWDGNRRRRILLVCALATCAIPAFSLLDQTRIFMLLSLPGLSLITVHFMKSADMSHTRIRVAEVAAWVGVPILIWTGYTGAGRVQYMGALDAQLISWQQIFAWF